MAHSVCAFGGVERYKNIVGPQVRKIRYQRGLKQRELAAKLEVAGWRIDRAGVAKIEARLIKVSDYQQIYLANALQATLEELFPPIQPHEQIRRAVQVLMSGNGSPELGLLDVAAQLGEAATSFSWIVDAMSSAVGVSGVARAETKRTGLKSLRCDGGGPLLGVHSRVYRRSGG